MAQIKKVFEDDGYKNVNVYSVGDKKIRVEVSNPTGAKTYSDVYSDLSAISSGKFYLSSKGSSDSSSSSTNTSEPVVVNGNECVKEVKIFTNNNIKYISIIFNSNILFGIMESPRKWGKFIFLVAQPIYRERIVWCSHHPNKRF